MSRGPLAHSGVVNHTARYRMPACFCAMSWIEIGPLVLIVLLVFVALGQLLLLRRRQRQVDANDGRVREATSLLEQARERMEAAAREVEAAAQAARDADARTQMLEGERTAAAEAADAAASTSAASSTATIWAANRGALFAAVESISASGADGESVAALRRVCAALDQACVDHPVVESSQAPGSEVPSDGSTRERELKQLVVKFTHDARNMLQHMRSLEREKETLLGLLAQHGINPEEPAGQTEPTRNAA